MASKTRPTIRVALVDAHPVVRSGLEALLARHARIAVVLKASSIAEAISNEASPPEVLILDAGSLGSETREIHRRFPVAKLIVFGSGDPEEEVKVARGGAHGYLSQSSPPAEIVRAVETVYGGGVHFGSRAARAHDVAVVQSEGEKGRFALLTQRERQVLILVAEGYTSRNIARRLRLGVRTVESHRERVGRKLGIRTVAGLTRFAVASGLVEAD
jgi:DNA-binding NarL/FixJ family response regulator